MTELQNLRLRFLLIAFLLCNLIVLPFNFFIPLKLTVPFWSFYLLETSFVFVVLFIAFPKIEIRSLIKISVVFLLFISLCFFIQGFLPFAPEHKILSFYINEVQNSLKIVINLVGVIVLHLASCFLFASELFRKVAPQDQTLQYKKEEPINQSLDQDIMLSDIPNFHNTEEQQVAPQEKLSTKDYISHLNEDSDYKESLNSLFDIYLEDYENNLSQEEQDLGNMETILIENLKQGITGAMCLNSQGEELHDPVFRWEGFGKFDLMELFQSNDNLSANLNEGSLCQMIFSDKTHWYLIAKYRGNYLLLQTTEKAPDKLIENSFYLVQAIRQFAH